MKNKAVLRMAASSLLIAGTMAGCSSISLTKRMENQAGKVERLADAQARDAEKAIIAHDTARAVTMAEAAVASAPEKAEWRILLGRAYLLNGRYGSAETAFQDAMTLGSKDPRAVVNLALVQTAQGQMDRARDLLNANIEHLSAADYGLAIAMAGNPDEAIRILSQAIHAPGATAKERQNLAYAYALSGRWTEARQMASLDLAPLDAAKRVASWAQNAQPGAESARVVAMIGVAPQTGDAGLPVRLALGQKPQAAVQMADASADDAPAAESAALSMIAAANEMEAADAPMPAPFEPVRQAAVEKPALPAPFLQPKPAAALKVAIPAASVPARPRPAGLFNPVDPSQGSSWVVQLGAFSSKDAAQASRTVFLSRHASLKAFPIINSSASVNGQAFYRVAIAGFADRGGAERLCGAIRTKGGSCFVRLGGSEAAPTRWAEALRRARPQQLAMR